MVRVTRRGIGFGTRRSFGDERFDDDDGARKLEARVAHLDFVAGLELGPDRDPGGTRDGPLGRGDAEAPACEDRSREGRAGQSSVEKKHVPVSPRSFVRSERPRPMARRGRGIRRYEPPGECAPLKTEDAEASADISRASHGREGSERGVLWTSATLPAYPRQVTRTCAVCHRGLVQNLQPTENLEKVALMIPN